MTCGCLVGEVLAGLREGPETSEASLFYTSSECSAALSTLFVPVYSSLF